RDIRLSPLMSLSGSVLDSAGKPLSESVLQLYRNVMYPGQSGRSFGINVETRNQVRGDGSYTFERLIPGATYSVRVEAEGHATATSEHVKIKPGQPGRLVDFRLPAADQAVRGIVVDPRGKPLAGIMV